MKEYTLNGYDKFEKLMADFTADFMKPLVEKKLDNMEFSTEQTGIEFIIFNGFTEISNSISTLRLIEKFVGINPPSEEGIDYSNYLIYHVHNYLQEMYILKERLKTYATKIQRKYAKAISEESVTTIIESLIQIITESLKNITGDGGARNLHVHTKKYADEELNWLSSITFLAAFNDEFKIHSEVAYNLQKNKWQKTIANNNKKLNKLIDLYFNTIYSIISVNGKVVLPQEYNQTSNKTL